jgi:hypothetical protein
MVHVVPHKEVQEGHVRKDKLAAVWIGEEQAVKRKKESVVIE